MKQSWHFLTFSIFFLAFLTIEAEAKKKSKPNRKPSSACAFVETRIWELDGKIPTDAQIDEWKSSTCQSLLTEMVKQCNLGIPEDYIGKTCQSRAEVDWRNGNIPMRNPRPFQSSERAFGQGRNAEEALQDMKNDAAKIRDRFVQQTMAFHDSCVGLDGAPDVDEVESKTPEVARAIPGTSNFEASGTVTAGGRCFPKLKTPKFVRGEFTLRFKQPSANAEGF